MPMMRTSTLAAASPFPYIQRASDALRRSQGAAALFSDLLSVLPTALQAQRTHQAGYDQER